MLSAVGGEGGVLPPGSGPSVKQDAAKEAVKEVVTLEVDQRGGQTAASAPLSHNGGGGEQRGRPLGGRIDTGLV